MYTVHTDSPDQHWPASADCDACVVLGDPLLPDPCSDHSTISAYTLLTHRPFICLLSICSDGAISPISYP